MSLNYPWQRRWLIKENSYKYDYQGFVSLKSHSWNDPDQEIGFALSDLAHVQCAVLLGAPGIGKSTELRKEVELEVAEEQSTFKVYIPPLNTRSSEDSILKLLTNNAKIKSWLLTTGRLYLYLDGLDEALLNINTIFDVITDWLEENKEAFGINNREVQRTIDEEESSDKRSLFLRISCRSAIWRKVYEEKLKSLFGENEFQIYDLAPLQQNDVKIAARAEDIDPDSFVEAISNANLATFASDPVSLKFVITAFKKGSLQQKNYNKPQIFYDGLLQLAEEINPSYKGKEQLSAEQRLRIASRVAVYTIFSNLPDILKPTEVSLDSLQKDSDLSPNHLVGDDFKIDGNYKEEITLQNLREVVNTGLFSLGSSNYHLTWKHRTYAEFLAAWHLHCANIPVKQIWQLISSPANPDKISPQLQETVLWLTAFKEELFDKLSRYEPLLLLRSERKFTAENKQYLTKRILSLSSQNELIEDYHDDNYFSKLCHPKLSEQLVPVITGKSQNHITQRIALSMAAACKAENLEDKLSEFLNNTNNLPYLRSKAIEALGSIQNEEIFLVLRPYALKPQESDENDELKGNALNLLYPNYLTTEETLTNLTKPKVRNLYGLYKHFISSLSQKIPENDLQIALDSILQQEYFFEDYNPGGFYQFVDAIIDRAWNATEINGVKNALVRLLKKLLDYDLNFKVTGDEKTRRNIALEVMKLIDDQDKLFDLFSNKLIQKQDWQWLAQIIEDDTYNLNLKRSAGHLILYIRNFQDVEYSSIVDVILDFVHRIDWFKTEFGEAFIKCDLDSIEANNQRERLSRQKAAEVESIEQEERRKLNYSPIDKALEKLASFENNDINGWWLMIYYMQQDEDLTKRKDDRDFDIMSLPVWKMMNSDSHSKIRSAALIYLERLDFPKSIEFYDRPALAVYKALLLLVSQQKTIPDEIWRKWTPLIVNYTFKGYISKTDLNYLLVSHAYESDKEQFLNCLEHEIVSAEPLYTLDKFEHIIDKDIVKLFLKLHNEAVITGQKRHIILHAIFKNDPEIILEVTKNQLERYDNDSEQLDKTLECASEALRSKPEKVWDILWPYVLKDSQFGKKLLESALADVVPHSTSLFKTSLFNLEPKDKADLLVWLYQHYPPAEDNDHDESFWVSKRDNVQTFRGSLLGNLMTQGTIEAYQALEFLIKELPEEKSSIWWLAEAKKHLIEKSFAPPEPKVLQKILQNAQQRLVRSSEELLDVVMESLYRLQKKLKGDNPTSYFLWDKQGDKSELKFKPKDENTLSDFVKMHLDYDLADREIIVNREVEIRRSTGSNGERTDIFVQAYGAASQDKPFTIVIEAKGCWHGEIDTAMKEQLCNRYLAEHKSNHGIYLVGWYHCSHYPVHNKHGTLNDLKEQLKAQAIKLTNSIVTIKSFVLDCSL